MSTAYSRCIVVRQRISLLTLSSIYFAALVTGHHLHALETVVSEYILGGNGVFYTASSSVMVCRDDYHSIDWLSFKLFILDNTFIHSLGC